MRCVIVAKEALVRWQLKSLPRGEGGPKGRVRNAGANLEVSTNKQTSTEADVQEEVLGFFVIERLPPAFLISQGIGSEEPIPCQLPPGGSVWVQNPTSVQEMNQ